MKSHLKNLALVLLVSTFAIVGCQEAPSPVAPVDNLAVQDINTPPPGVKFIKLSYPIRLSKETVSSCVTLNPNLGGIIGGEETYGNFAYLPPRSFEKRTDFCLTVSDVPGFTACDYSPSMKFRRPVELTFDLSDTEFTEEEIESLKIYYWNEEKNEWEIVNGKYTYDDETITVMVKHFSRYAWAN
ncbi:MAG: hypothetical protein KJ666_07385 [Bacteroidetes bacterium]|nr:hypothetical protein [Bacteroidota bacterium]